MHRLFAFYFLYLFGGVIAASVIKKKLVRKSWTVIVGLHNWTGGRIEGKGFIDLGDEMTGAGLARSVVLYLHRCFCSLYPFFEGRRREWCMSRIINRLPADDCSFFFFFPSCCFL
jgi:hypothetical protein